MPLRASLVKLLPHEGAGIRHHLCAGMLLAVDLALRVVRLLALDVGVDLCDV